MTGDFSRVTFLIASATDTTLVIHTANGHWSCDDDTNGLNPALVFYNAQAGAYRIWIGSYAEDTFDESALYVSEAGPGALPTTATGPDPTRAPLYGDASLSPGFQPAPFTTQITGGGHSQAADFIADERCRGYISEAPDFSISLDESFDAIAFAVYSPARMTLVIHASDGKWRCSDGREGEQPSIGLRSPPAGQYDLWVGSAAEGNYAAAILYASESEPDDSLSFTIDTNCDGLPPTSLQVGMRAQVSRSAGGEVNLHAAPETASTVIARAAPGSSLALVGGPVCKAAHRWWRAEVGDHGGAWVADGDAATRWLEPHS